MTGFQNNVIGGVEHFFARLGGEIDADLKATLTLLHPSIVAVENVVKTHGTAFAQVLVSTMATAALAAVTGGTGTTAELASAAGKAAIAAGEALAATQGKEIATDALHAIATAQVSAAQAAAT